MAKVDTSEYGSQYPGLPADVLAFDQTVLHLAGFEDIPGRGNRTTRVVEFREYPGQYLYLNVEDLKTICAKVSDDDDNWAGAEIALMKETVYSKRQKRNVKVWRIASVQRWDNIIAQKRAAEEAQTSGASEPTGRGARSRSR